MKQYIIEAKRLQKLAGILQEAELSNSDKSNLVKKFAYTNPKLLTGQQKAEYAKNFKRNKDNTFNYKGTNYSKEDILKFTQEPWAADMFDKDDIGYIEYYFDKWPKKGSNIELKGSNIHHFVNITPTDESFYKKKYPNGKSEDIEGLFVFVWNENGKSYGMAHSLDDTWFKLEKIQNNNYKIIDVINNN